MSKPYLDTDFSVQITEDRTWRLKEISDLKATVDRSDAQSQRVLLRALVAICYAHWEGYIRFAARKYIEFVAIKRKKFSELDRQFVRNYFLPRLAALSTSKSSISERCALIEEILNSAERRFSRINENLINTKANLNFDVFQDICLVCSVPVEPFADKEDFIDRFLLKRRNSIAHGEDTFIEIKDIDSITNDTIALMRSFGDALENRVYLKSYLSV
jgi:hypothetical protein